MKKNHAESIARENKNSHTIFLKVEIFEDKFPLALHQDSCLQLSSSLQSEKLSRTQYNEQA